jgi:hypothetical protein
MADPVTLNKACPFRKLNPDVLVGAIRRELAQAICDRMIPRHAKPASLYSTTGAFGCDCSPKIQPIRLPYFRPVAHGDERGGTVEYRSRHRDGHYIWIQDTFRVITD